MNLVNITPEQIKLMTTDELAKYTAKLAKRANQRLRNLESSTKGDASYAEFSYAYAKFEQKAHALKQGKYSAKTEILDFTRHYFLSDSTKKNWSNMSEFERNQWREVKFKTTFRGRTRGQIKNELNALIDFLNSPSSSKREIDTMHARAYKTFIQNNGINPEFFTFKDYVNFWTSEAVQSALAMFGSTEVVKIIGEFSPNAIDNLAVGGKPVNREISSGLKHLKGQLEMVAESYQKTVDGVEMQASTMDYRKRKSDLLESNTSLEDPANYHFNEAIKRAKFDRFEHFTAKEQREFWSKSEQARADFYARRHAEEEEFESYENLLDDFAVDSPDEW